MLQYLLDRLIVAAQMGGLIIVACGALYVVGGIFSGRIGSLVKGGVLIVVGAAIGGYIGGFGTLLH